MSTKKNKNSDTAFPNEPVKHYPFKHILFFPDFGKFQIQSLSEDLLKPVFFICPKQGITVNVNFENNPNFKIIKINGEQYNISFKLFPQIKKENVIDVKIHIGQRENKYKELFGKIFCGSIFGIDSTNYKILPEVAEKVLGFDKDLIKLFNYIDVYISQANKITLLSELEAKIFSLSTDIYTQANNKLICLNSRKEVDLNKYVARFIYFLASSRPHKIKSISKYAQNLCDIESNIQINKNHDDATSQKAKYFGFLSLRDEIEKYFIAILSDKSNFYLYRHFYECGLLNKEKLLEKIDSIDNYQGLKWFMDILPPNLENKMIDMIWDMGFRYSPAEQEKIISFFELMKQNNFTLFKHVVEIGENQDPTLQAIQKDDVRTLQEILSKISIDDLSDEKVGYLFYEYDLKQFDIYPFSGCQFLNIYASFFGAEKCFNYLYLNKIGRIKNIVLESHGGSKKKFVMISQNPQILHTIDQEGAITCDFLPISIRLHLPSIYQWIIDNHPVPVCKHNPDLLPPEKRPPPQVPGEDPYTGKLNKIHISPDEKDYMRMKDLIMKMVKSSITHFNFIAFINILYNYNFTEMFKECATISLNKENMEIFKFVFLLIDKDDFFQEFNYQNAFLNLESYRIICIFNKYGKQQIDIFNSNYKNSFLDGEHKFDVLAAKVLETNRETKGKGNKITKDDIFIKRKLLYLTMPQYDIEVFKILYLYKRRTSNYENKGKIANILREAIVEKNYGLVKFLISYDKNIVVNINSCIYSYETLKRVVELDGCIAILGLLLQEPMIKVNKTAYNPQTTALILAAGNEWCLAKTRILCNSKNIDINKLGEDGESPLTESIKNKNIHITNFLVTSCPNLEINKMNRSKKNAIDIVLSKKHFNIVLLKILLKHPKVKYNFQTLLDLAIQNNDTNLIEMIINHPQFNLDKNQIEMINDKITETNLISFLEMIKNKDKLGINDISIENVVARVAEISFYDSVYKGKMPEMTNSYPYHCAIEKRKVEVIKYLLKFPNIDICKVSKGNKITPLIFAQSTQQHEIFSILLENLSIIKEIEKDQQKIIYLGYLIQKCNTGNQNKCIDCLLEACKNVGKNDINGKNALYVLSNSDKFFIFTLLDNTNEKFFINMFLIFKKDFIDYILKLDDKEIIQQILHKASAIISIALQGLEEPAIMTLVKNNKFSNSYQFINKIDVNCQDNKGNTLLMVAINCNDLDLVISTLSAPNIQINLKNHDGKTACDIANEDNKSNIGALICKIGCKNNSLKEQI